MVMVLTASASRSRSDLPVRVRLARTTAEVEAAYDLAARVFGPTYHEARAHKHALVRDVEPLEGPQDVVVALSGETVVGIIRLVVRRMRFGADRFNVIGITSVAVDPAHRNSGVGAKLMRVSMAEGRRRGDDLAVLFARRAVDGWYPKFGFLGLGQHVECHVTSTVENARRGQRWHAGFDRKALAAYRALYEVAYRTIPGSFIRGRDWWSGFEARLRLRKHTELLTFWGTRHTPEAYAAIEGERVIEMGTTSRSVDAATATLVAEMHRRGVATPVFALHPAHIGMRTLYAGNHTLSLRRAWDGGHMAGPLSRAAAARLRSHGIGSTPAASRPGDISLWPVWSGLDEF